MKTFNDSLTAQEEKSRKSNLFFTALTLSALMVSAVGGGAAFMIYHEFAAMPGDAQAAVTHVPQTTRLTKLANASSLDRLAPTTPMNRPVAAESSDHSDFRYADNTVLPPAEARRVIAAWRSNPVVSNVPPALEKLPDAVTEEAANRPPLTDPESHYIVSATTGQIVGVDGSVSAAAEARRQPAPVALAAQLPPPEVRVATPVQVRAALPVTPDDADASYTQDSIVPTAAQPVPVRHAQAVVTGRSFDAASYLASEDNRPVMRAQAIITPASRTAGYR